MTLTIADSARAFVGAGCKTSRKRITPRESYPINFLRKNGKRLIATVYVAYIFAELSRPRQNCEDIYLRAKIKDEEKRIRYYYIQSLASMY